MTSQDQSLPSGGVAIPPREGEDLPKLFDNGIWYALCLWHNLNIAVSNGWGGPDSADKRDWFAGAISDLFNSRPDTDQEDVEIFLLQILQDEFDVNIEDESEVEVARSIIALRKTLYNDHDTSYALDLERRWKSKGKSRTDVQVAEHNQEVDDDEVDDFDEDGDTEMADNPPQLIPVKPKEKIQPEIDDDGFTKVVSRKHR